MSPFKWLRSRRDFHNFNNWTDFNVREHTQRDFSYKFEIFIRFAACSLKKEIRNPTLIHKTCLLSHCSNAITSSHIHTQLENTKLILNGIAKHALCLWMIYSCDVICVTQTILYKEREKDRCVEVPFLPSLFSVRILTLLRFLWTRTHLRENPFHILCWLCANERI